MADVLIPNMEMPKIGDAIHLTIFGNGEVFEEDYFGNVKRIINAKEVPTHGRLIDASSEIKRIKEMQEVLPDTEKGNKIYYEYDGIIDYLYDANTVIEASK